MLPSSKQVSVCPDSLPSSKPAGDCERAGTDTDDDVVAAYFTAQSSYWSALYEPSNARLSDYTRCVRAFMGRRRALVLSALDAHCGGGEADVLDAGCGAGAYSHEIAQRGHRVTAVDASTAMLKATRERLNSFATARVLKGDIQHLEFAAGSFDAVVSVGVLEYVSDVRQAVSELARVTRTGGVLIVTFPNLLKLSHVLDPYYYVVRCPQYVLARVGRRRPTPSQLSSPRDVVGRNVGFDCRRFTRAQVSRVFESFGCRSVARHDVCFSSPTLWQRRVLSVETTLALSRHLCATSSRRGFGWLGGLADRWVFLFRKES